MTKAEWLEQGKALGAKASDSGWEIGKWLVQGEEQFLGTVPSSKKAKRIYFANRRANWMALMREAAQVTNLTDTTLRRYASVVRKGVRVEGLSFSHHLEVLRARTMQYVNPKRESELRFDHQAARDILNLAKEKGWTAAETRAEAVRRFPTPQIVGTELEKAKRILAEILKTIAGEASQLEFLDALTAELSQVREQIVLEGDVLIQKTFFSDDADVPLESSDVPY
jgi:hypothetical protein